MKSRLNQSNNGTALPSLRWGAPGIVDSGALRTTSVALGYWVPSSPMPRTALRQAHHRQPPATDQPVLGERLDRVLTARGGESTRWQPQRRNGVAVQLDQEDQSPGHHRRAPSSSRARSSAVRSCCSSRAEMAYLLLGSARITTRSAGSKSATTERAMCRSRRATRCRCTELPTDFATTSPTLGPHRSASLHRRACTTMSGCTARTPWLTVAPNSVDRVIRYRAGSTALDPASNHADSARRPLRRRPDTIARPARVRIRSRNPCTRARRRLLG